MSKHQLNAQLHTQLNAQLIEELSEKFGDSYYYWSLLNAGDQFCNDRNRVHDRILEKLQERHRRCRKRRTDVWVEGTE